MHVNFIRWLLPLYLHYRAVSFHWQISFAAYIKPTYQARAHPLAPLHRLCNPLSPVRNESSAAPLAKATLSSLFQVLPFNVRTFDPCSSVRYVARSPGKSARKLLLRRISPDARVESTRESNRSLASFPLLERAGIELTPPRCSMTFNSSAAEFRVSRSRFISSRPGHRDICIFVRRRVAEFSSISGKLHGAETLREDEKRTVVSLSIVVFLSLSFSPSLSSTSDRRLTN